MNFVGPVFKSCKAFSDDLITYQPSSYPSDFWTLTFITQIYVFKRQIVRYIFI